MARHFTTNSISAEHKALRSAFVALAACGGKLPKAQASALEAFEKQAADKQAAAKQAGSTFMADMAQKRSTRAERKAAGLLPKTPVNPYFSQSGRSLVADGSEGAIAELARRGRNAAGKRAAPVVTPATETPCTVAA
jgi:hypothetical protein